MKVGTFVAGYLVAQAMMQAQTSVDLRTQARNVDFSLAGSTRPVKTGTALPAGCSSGEMYFLSSAPSGQNLHGCTATNTWSQLSGASTGSGGLSSLGGQTGAVQTLVSDTNVTISSAGDTHTLGWSGTLAVSRGGTGHGAFLNGDLLYASGAAALSRLGIGSNGQCLIVSGGIPAWGPCPADPNAALRTSSNTFSAGAKQIFQPSATSAGANIAAAGLPSSPATGDLAVDSGDGNTLKQYDGTAWRRIAAAASVLTSGAILQGGGNNQITTIPSNGTGDVVRANSPVIATPSIASFASANHDHGNAANGGAISNNALPNTFDISGKASTKSVKTGTAAPASCAVGELFYDTDAAAGLNLYGCTGTNLWTLLGDGGGGGGGITSFGGQTGASQTFANDTNITITSSANTHTLGWSGTLSKLRQNASTVYTDQGNTWSAGAQDFSATASFRGRSGASDPPACALGELFFHTSENVQKVCSQLNVWTLLRAVVPGSGVTLVHSGSTTTVSADTAVMLSQATNQANTSKYCADSGLTDSYTCNVTPALTTYTAGMFDIFRPNTNSTGATTKNVNGLGLRNIKLSDGTTDPPDNTLLGGRLYATIYDGSAWRTLQSIVSGGNVSGILPVGNGGTGSTAGAVLNPAANGLATCIGTNCSGSTARSINGTANEITATNGDGVSGNPTLAIASTFDISGKTSTKPVKTGTTAPATCSIGELFYDTDASAGQNLLGCTSTNTWTQLGGGGSGSFGETSLAGLVNHQTLWNSSQASRTLTAGLSGATDPVITFADNSISSNVPIAAPGFFTPSGTGNAGFMEFTQGTACSPTANSVCEYAPTSIGTAYGIVKPPAVGTTGVVKVSVSGAVATYSHAAIADADMPAKYRTRQVHFKVWGTGASNVLQDTDDELSIFNNQLGFGITITKVTCESDAGTPSIQLQRDDGAPANMLVSSLSCASSPPSTTSFNSTENQIADTHRIDFLVDAAGGSAHWVAVTITYTVD